MLFSNPSGRSFGGSFRNKNTPTISKPRTVPQCAKIFVTIHDVANPSSRSFGSSLRYKNTPIISTPRTVPQFAKIFATIHYVANPSSRSFGSSLRCKITFTILGSHPSRIELNTTMVNLLAIAPFLVAVILNSNVRASAHDPFAPAFCPAIPENRTEYTSILDQLSPEEVKSVAEYLEGMFDVIREDPEDLADCHSVNRLFKVTKFPPPKNELLGYLDSGGPEPARYAEAMIIRAPLDIMHYKVGPLPLVEGEVEVIPITEEGQIPWNSRPYVYGCERRQERTVIDPALEVLAPIFKATANGYCMVGEGCREGMSLSLTADPQSSPFDRLSVVRFRIQPSVFNLTLDQSTGSPSSSMFVIPMTLKLHHTGPDTSTWFLSDFEYCGQGPFASAEELFSLWEFGHVTTCHTGLDDEYDASWSHLGQRGPIRPMAELAPPVISYPEGPRFSVEGRYVRWMDWNFHFDMHPSWGPLFHDLKFKGERIMYEMGLQETYAAYSGNSGHGEIMFLDAHYSGLGNRAYNLQKGVDCPEASVYLPGPNGMDPFNPSIRPDSQCIFEMINGETNVRHTAGGVPTASVRTFLVVKQVITVGNYDYVLTFEFHVDGEFFIKMDAAGYMQTSYWYEDEEGFGVPVQLWQVGVLHDHLFSFKMDFDILGTENNFKETRFEVVPARGPTNTGRLIKKAVHETIAQEEGFVVDSAIPRHWVIYNPNEKNKWGTERGYTLHFEGTIYNILPPTHPWSRAASWSNYNVMVTKRKETEQVTTHEGNMLVGGYPVVDAASWMDGESIIEEDLVLWTTIGKMHLPRSEDVPVVTNFGVTLAVRPWDYFDENQAFDMPYKPVNVESCAPHVGVEYDYNHMRLKTMHLDSTELCLMSELTMRCKIYELQAGCIVLVEYGSVKSSANRAMAETMT